MAATCSTYNCNKQSKHIAGEPWVEFGCRQTSLRPGQEQMEMGWMDARPLHGTARLTSSVFPESQPQAQREAGLPGQVTVAPGRGQELGQG